MKRTKTKAAGHTHDVCPKCSAELCGGLIAQAMVPVPEGGWPAERVRSLYGDSLCYNKTIGIEYPLTDPRHYDGVSVWLYPCCGALYDRFTGEFAGWQGSAFAIVGEKP